MGLISGVSSRTYRKFPKNSIMADAPKKRRTFKKFSYRGVEMDKLLDMNSETLHKMFNCRHRRAFNRGVSRRHNTVIKRMRIAKKNCPALEKPKPVKTHCRNLTILQKWSVILSVSTTVHKCAVSKSSQKWLEHIWENMPSHINQQSMVELVLELHILQGLSH